MVPYSVVEIYCSGGTFCLHRLFSDLKTKAVSLCRMLNFHETACCPPYKTVSLIIPAVGPSYCHISGFLISRWFLSAVCSLHGSHSATNCIIQLVDTMWFATRGLCMPLVWLVQLACTENNIQAVYMHMRLTMNGILKYFSNKGGL